MAKPVDLENGTCFKTQSQAIAYFKGILNSEKKQETRYSNAHPLFSDLLALYRRHPEFSMKSGGLEVQEFIAKNSGQYNTRCFHALHIDGSEADWSYKAAVNSQGKSRFQCFTDAARYLLESSSSNFRDSNFSLNCKKFLEFRCVTQDSIPDDWVSSPEKLQYRSTLSNHISKDFIQWYEKNTETSS
ncbi:MULTISPECIES: DUF3223 domain-containing protein [Vibrio]|uniref:DUF3223 domain-containing protein n=1 Tax=Vibrio sp. R78045 TaxID=3093868 RepID=UPI0035517408